jgi:hypothetical protein
MAFAQFAAEPTARNSNLFAKAKGEVLFCQYCRATVPECFCGGRVSGLLHPARRILPQLFLYVFKHFCQVLPDKHGKWQGGASFAPKRKSLPAEAMEALNTSL